MYQAFIFVILLSVRASEISSLEAPVLAPSANPDQPAIPVHSTGLPTQSGLQANPMVDPMVLILPIVFYCLPSGRDGLMNSPAIFPLESGDCTMRTISDLEPFPN